MFTSWSEWEGNHSNGTISLWLRCQLTQRFSLRWVTSINRNKMNSKLSTITKSHTDTTLQKLMLSHVLVCIMLNRICLKRQFFSSRELLRSKAKRLNGNSWSLLATEEWTYLMMRCKCMKTSTVKTMTILIASEALFRSERNSECHTSNSVRSSWSLIERKKQSASNTANSSLAKDKTNMVVVATQEAKAKDLVMITAPTTSSHKCQTWTISNSINLREKWLQRPSMMTKTRGGAELETYWIEKPDIIINNHSKLKKFE